MRYLFLDIFALERLTKDHSINLKKFLINGQFHLVVSPFQLMEYYSPIINDGERTDRAVKLLSEHPFVIVNQEDVYQQEEMSYPAILNDLPFKLRSEAVLTNLKPEDRITLLYRMMHEGIADGNFHLEEWATTHHATKLDWPKQALAIIENAEAKQIIRSKANFVQTLDLRFCLKILDAVEKFGDPIRQDAAFKKNISKLSGMQKRMDTWRMRGIHLSSLIFWYDYVVAKKKIKASDEGDLFHSMIFPYCDIVITDNSRVDCLHTIQRKERLYLKTDFLRISDFIEMIKR